MEQRKNHAFKYYDGTQIANNWSFKDNKCQQKPITIST